jgi:hypothetical protein
VKFRNTIVYVTLFKSIVKPHSSNELLLKFISMNVEIKALFQSLLNA